MATLTDRQEQILRIIAESVQQRGYPPSVREICDAIGLKSPSSAHYQLNQLEKGGYIRRDPDRPRAIEVRYDMETSLPRTTAQGRSVPLVGEIAAGGPIVAEERVEELYELPRDLVGDGDLFMLRIRGDSMVEAGILDGDLVVVRRQQRVEQGQLCAALIEGEATVKRFVIDRQARFWLMPANPAYEPIPFPEHEHSAIMGKVVAVLRRV